MSKLESAKKLHNICETGKKINEAGEKMHEQAQEVKKHYETISELLEDNEDISLLNESRQETREAYRKEKDEKIQKPLNENINELKMEETSIREGERKTSEASSIYTKAESLSEIGKDILKNAAVHMETSNKEYGELLKRTSEISDDFRENMQRFNELIN